MKKKKKGKNQEKPTGQRSLASGGFEVQIYNITTLYYI